MKHLGEPERSDAVELPLSRGERERLRALLELPPGRRPRSPGAGSLVGLALALGVLVGLALLLAPNEPVARAFLD